MAVNKHLHVDNDWVKTMAEDMCDGLSWHGHDMVTLWMVVDYLLPVVKLFMEKYVKVGQVEDEEVIGKTKHIVDCVWKDMVVCWVTW